jgi:hypothetical protein
MVNKRNVNILLFAVLVAAFIYRFALLTWNTFPPGADIGLHQSVINSILAPKTTFIYNYYHMGGGISVTNPGYHIFAAFIISMTGATDYLVQAAVTALFSTLIVLCSFMVVKLIWGELAGFVVAVLAAFSASDIIMLCWAGYPNVVTLALIPLLFYLFLQPTKLSQTNYLIVTAIITSALFLTHMFSAIIFLTIASFALIISVAFSKSTGFTKKKAASWIIPTFFGFILASPYILSVLPTYFGSQGAITGAVSVMKQAVVETRTVPTLILVLAIMPIVLFLVFSKKRTGNYLTLPSVLFASAMLVPVVAAQCYLLGFFLDYERFLYFLALPAIACVGLVIVELSRIIPNKLQKSRVKASAAKLKPVLLTILVVVCLLTPLFTLPSVAFEQASFYQVMDPAKYQAIQWIKANTTEKSVIVSDAEYGWWISGFSQRPTLSAVDPQYLILQREFAPAQVARNLLKADYSMDNGLLEIEQAGAYANDSTHEIYAITNSSIIKPLVFSINDLKVSLLYRDGNLPEETNLANFTSSNTQVLQDGNSTSFIITRENAQYRITEEITLTQGTQFARITFSFQNFNDTSFDWIRIPFQSRGELVQYANSIGIIDNTLHIANQVVFPDNQLGKDVLLEENADSYELVFNLGGKDSAQATFYAGLYQYEPNNSNSGVSQTSFYESLIENSTKTYLNQISGDPVECFDYRAALTQWNIDYIVVCDPIVIERFSSDATFKVAYENSEVTIFQVAR